MYMYVFKFTSSTALMYPLNVIHVDHTFTVAETIKFLGLFWTVTYHGSLT